MGAIRIRAVVRRETVSVGVELLRDAWHVVPRFLEDHSMEATTSCWNDLRVVLASWARIPLEHGETVLQVAWDRSVSHQLGPVHQPWAVQSAT